MRVLALPGKIARLARSLSAAQARPDDRWAARFLTPGEMRVFLLMDPRDREHALRVARHLLRDFPQAPETLLAGALLHDCGKSVRPYRVWERVVAGVLPERHARRDRLGPLDLRFLAVRARHPELGARLVRAAGGRARVAELVERHHAPGADWEARVLHRYDDRE